jgi:cobalt-zinc-cadmium resistance protein CzcA
MFGSAKWAGLILANVAIAPIGGLLALLITGTHLSVSSGVGFLALFGVSVETGVIMLEYINQLRASGHSIEDAAIEGAVLRLRPIMMTMLVATLGRLGLATSVRNCYRRRPLGSFAFEYFLVADPLCLGRSRRRQTPRSRR